MNGLINRYFWGARAAPAIIIALPIVVALFTSISGFSSAIGGILAGTAVSAALLLLGGTLARHMGKRIESDLWESWGGPPTTRLLRWADTTRTAEWKRRMHDRVDALVGIQLLSPDDEVERPEDADALIADATGILRSRLRTEQQAGLVTTANIEYGFARNLLGCRGIWLLTSVAGVAICLVANLQGTENSSAGLIMCTLILLVSLATGYVVLPGFTKKVAEQYAGEFWSVVANIGRVKNKKG